MKKKIIMFGIFFAVFLMVSSATAVPQVNGENNIKKIEQYQKINIFLENAVKQKDSKLNSLFLLSLIYEILYVIFVLINEGFLAGIKQLFELINGLREELQFLIRIINFIRLIFNIFRIFNPA